MKFSEDEKPEYIKMEITKEDGLNAEVEMGSDNIAFVIGRLLQILERNNFATQEDAAKMIIDTNRHMENEKK